MNSGKLSRPLIGEDPSIQKVLNLVAKVAPTDSSVLVLGESGIVDGQISCQSAIIGGQIKAKITTKDILTLKSTAKLSGEIEAGQLAIEPGAIFSGKCSMGPIVKKISKGDTKNLEQDKEKLA